MTLRVYRRGSSVYYDDGYGTLWLGGYIENNGLTLFDKETERFTNYKHDPYDFESLSNDLVGRAILPGRRLLTAAGSAPSAKTRSWLGSGGRSRGRGPEARRSSLSASTWMRRRSR